MILKSIFNSCQYLEIIEILCDGPVINEEEMLKIKYIDNPLNISIIQYCPNLKYFFTFIEEKNELMILKSIFNSCQYLEIIEILCDGPVINEEEMLKIKYIDNPLNISIIQYCPNLKYFFTFIEEKNELMILKSIFNSCQYLEIIEILCDGPVINEEKLLKNIYQKILLD